MTHEAQLPVKVLVPWWCRRGPHTVTLEVAFWLMLAFKLAGWSASWWLVLAPILAPMAAMPFLVLIVARRSRGA